MYIYIFFPLLNFFQVVLGYLFTQSARFLLRLGKVVNTSILLTKMFVWYISASVSISYLTFQNSPALRHLNPRKIIQIAPSEPKHVSLRRETRRIVSPRTERCFENRPILATCLIGSIASGHVIDGVRRGINSGRFIFAATAA